MKEVIKRHKFTPRNEDVLFCNYMIQSRIGNIAPRYVCEEFACETMFKLGTIGVHAIEKWLTEEDCKQILSQYENI